MPANIEIKARVRNFPDLQRRAETLSASPPQVLPQEDIFFATAHGRLKLRLLAPERGQLICYTRPDQEGPKRSDYEIFETDAPEQLRAVLGAAYGIRGIVRKTRYLYLVGQTRLHLDLVEGLGAFVELEVILQDGQSEAEARAIAEDLMQKLNISRADLLEGAYIDLLERVEHSTEENMPKIKRIHHLAVVVEEMEKSLAFWRDALGLELHDLRQVAAEASQVAFLPLEAGEIELVRPLSADSGIARFLARRGPGMHHVCLEVDDLEAMLNHLKAKGVRLIHEEPRLTPDGKKYAFIHPEAGGGVLIELYQAQPCSNL